MSAAEQSALGLRSPRRIPSSVRLGTRVLNELYAHLGDDQARREAGVGAAGLLFGIVEQDLVKVERVDPFPAADLTEGGFAKHEYLEAAFDRVLAAKADAEGASLQLVGWYCVRSPGDPAPLSDRDLEFHNRRFRRATDLVLALQSQQHTGISIDLYTRAYSKAAISRQDFRSGSLRLAVEGRASTASDVTMRANVDDDYYLRVFHVLDSLDRAERKPSWKRVVLSAQRIARFSLVPKWRRDRVVEGVDTATVAAPDKSLAGAPSILAPGPSESAPNGLPLRRTPSAQSKNSTTPLLNGSTSPQPPVRVMTARAKPAWITSAVLLMLAAGVALTWTYARPFLSALPWGASFLRIPANTRLDMRVEPQAGSSLLLRWNAHALALQNMKGGVLEIDDGSEHRKVHLDSNQVANGSILYTPISKDLLFRLEVFNDNGSPISETMRVINGSKSALQAHGIPSPPPSTPSVAMRVPKRTQAFQQGDTTSQKKGTQLPSTEEPSNSKIAGAKRASLPDINVGAGGNAPAPAANSPITAEARFPTRLAATVRQSGTAAATTTRAPMPKTLEPERQTQRRNPAIINSAESSAGERSANRTHSSSGEPEPRKPAKDLASAQSSIGSALPTSTKSSSEKLAPRAYVPAQPVRRVMPNTNLLGQSLLASIDVDVEVRIDTAGFVTEARVENSHAANPGLMNNHLLESAALASAREWIFEPAKVDGRSVASNHTITFHFRPQVGRP